MNREEAIETVRRCCPRISDSKCDFETAMRVLVPELAESEDERIRKLIRSLLENTRAVQSNTSLYKQYDDALSWLEKQKEHQNNSDAPNESSWSGMISSSDKDKNLDEIAQDYVDGVKEYNPEPTWDLIQTAVCYGYHLAEQKEQKPVDDSDFKTKLAEYMMKNRTGYSYSISSESILEMAKEELIKRGELKEQEPINSFDIVPYIDDKIAALQDMWREEKVAFDWDDMHEMIEDVARHFYQKEQNYPDSTGLYYYDGKKFTCCGLPYNFTMNQQEEQKTVAISENNNSDANGHLTGKILVEYGAHAKVRDGKRHCEMDWKEFQRLAHYFYELGKTEQKPAEWSEEDSEECKRSIIWYLEAAKNPKDTYGLGEIDQDIAWLKSLRPQKKQNWRPNAQQLAALDMAIETLIGDPIVVYLVTLREDFKKL